MANHLTLEEREIIDHMHRAGKMQTQISISVLAESGRARVVTKRVLNGEEGVDILQGQAAGSPNGIAVGIFEGDVFDYHVAIGDDRCVGGDGIAEDDRRVVTVGHHGRGPVGAEIPVTKTGAIPNPSRGAGRPVGAVQLQVVETAISLNVKGQETDAGNFDYLAMSTTHRNPIVEQRSRPGHTNSSFVALLQGCAPPRIYQPEPPALKYEPPRSRQ